MVRFLLFIAVLAVSTAAPLVRMAAPAPALTVAATRVLLAGVLLTALARLGHHAPWRLFAGLPGREKLLLLSAGLLLGAHFGVWISSLYWTSTAAAVALVATQPIFAALFARALGDSIGPREILGMTLATVGCTILGGGDLLAGSTGALIGDLLALAGAATAAGHLLVGRRLRVSMPLLPYLALVNTIAGAGLLSVALITRAPFVGFAPPVYLAIALAAVVPSLIGHTLLNWAVRRTPAHMVSLAILGEPIGASALTWLFFAEIPPPHAVLGGAVILMGILAGFVPRAR
jgi:drug/metabolite transporter (DMT)-like permease